MKKICYILLSELFLFISSFAGEHETPDFSGFAPIGAKWTYEFEGKTPSFIKTKGLHILEVNDEIHIDGHIVKTIDKTIITPHLNFDYSEIWHDTITFKNSIYLYMEGDTAYASIDSCKTFGKMFIFNASEGDTLTLNDISCNHGEYKMIIDSVIETENDLKKYKGDILKYDTRCGFEEWFMDKIGGIGSNSYLWPQLAYLSGSELNFSSYSEKRGLNYSKNGFAELLQTEEYKNPFSIYPNPVISTLYITTEKDIVDAKIYDINGNLSLATKKGNIDCSSLGNGIYFLSVIFEDNSKIIQKIIKE
ncbi:MAG: T9SS type A sorting domain-containing protein [Prevotellaceae bacterium]|nr:T9SS type A sorting domain-containing protein [Prevotellaceae bacterium]